MRNFKTIQDILGTLPEIKRIYLIGCTGAGKTSLVQHIIGSKKQGFPVTTHRRTTIAPTEYVIKSDIPFKTTIILKKKQDIVDSIEELIQFAILKAKEDGSSVEDIVYELEQSADERFKLNQMVSSASFTNIATEINKTVLPSITNKGINDETLFSDPIIKQAIKKTTTDVLTEIESNFKKTCGSGHTLFSDIPVVIKGINNKDDFIIENKKLLSHEFGSIAMLAEYVRVEGNLLVDWLDNSLEFVLIDGEGIGHSLGEKRDTLSARHYDFFNFCNNIILLDDAGNPFAAGGHGAIEGIFLNGYQNKFRLVFSKTDKLEQSDQDAYFRRNINNLKNALKKDDIEFKVENKDSYKLKGLDKQSIHEDTKKEISKLLLSIHNAQEDNLRELEYDFNLLFSNFQRDVLINAIQSTINEQHWAVVKALTKRLANDEIEYRHLKPLSWILMFIMRDINLFLKRQDDLLSEVCDSQNIIKQNFSNHLIRYIYLNFIKDKNHLWLQAFEKKGIGSHTVRKEFIFGQILNNFLPRRDEIDAFSQFRSDIKALLKESGAKEIKTAKSAAITHVSIKKIFGYKNIEWSLDQDTNILIGKNGSGKSTILKLIYACINDDVKTLESYKSPSIKLTISKTYDNGEVQESIITQGQSLANMSVVLINTFDIKYDENNQDIIDLDSQLKNLVDKFGEYQRSLTQIVNKKVSQQKIERDDLFKNISTATSEDLSRLQQLSIEIKTATDDINKPLLEFKTLVDDYFSGTHKSLVIDDEDAPLLVKIEDKSEPIRVISLSSGEKQLLIIFLTVILQKDKPFILLMDEPESSLHVEWQSSFIDNIKRLNVNIQIIIATHNPLIALNREQDEIGTIEINSDVVKTGGTGTKYLDVSAILLNYFHLSSLVGTEMKSKLKELFDLKTLESLSDDEVAKLDKLEKELGGTLATNFIYDRHYLHFLKFIKENYDIDFDKLTQISEEKMDALLGEFKGLFDD